MSMIRKFQFKNEPFIYYNQLSPFKYLVEDLQYKIGIIHPDLDIGRVRFKNNLLALCPHLAWDEIWLR